MSTQPFNPFLMPNMGQTNAESAVNPLIASMDMMRHAMAGLTGQVAGQSGAQASAGSSGLSFTQALDPQEIERRIHELKVVENWLKLNLSMLTSTIQGLEVQLATIQTLKSFAAMGAGLQAATSTAYSPESANLSNPSHSSDPSRPSHPSQSPLETVLGMSPKPAAASTTEPTSSESPPQGDLSNPPPAAGQAWWNMLERQFAQIASATQAPLQTMATATPQTQSDATQAGAVKRRKTAPRAPKTSRPAQASTRSKKTPQTTDRAAESSSD